MMALITAATLLSAMLLSGTAYAWCPHMERAAPSCCHGPRVADTDLAADDAQAAAPSGPEAEAPCCESRVVSELPNGDRAPLGAVVALATTVLAAPVVLDAPAPSFIPTEASRARVAAPIRAGPRTALERCILLSTFLH
jgi:hypothetical protein